MAANLSFDREALRRGGEPMKRRTLTALKRAVGTATEIAKLAIRQAIRERTTSTRLPNIIGSIVFPTGSTLSYTPSGSVYPRGPSADNIFRQLGEGAVIRVKNAKALAIPVHGRRNSRGQMLPPSAFPGLRYIPSRKGARGVGVLALPSSRTVRGKLTARDRRAQGAKSRARVQGRIGQDWVAMFILVRVVRIPKAFDVADIIKRATSIIPAAFNRFYREAA